MARSTPLAIIEGFYLAKVLDFFLRTGALDLLRNWATANEVATRLDRDPVLIRALLEFAVEGSDVVIRDRRDRYRLNPKYLAWSALGFQIEKFVGAYGPSFTLLDERTLPAGGLGAGVNGARLAAAYAGLDPSGPSIVGKLIGEWAPASLLDLGCGVANLLLELARSNKAFRGWGIDANDSMCNTARARIAAAGMGDRISVWQGRVENLKALDEITDASVIHAGSLLNALFWPDRSRAVRLVTDLSQAFPERLLFVSDYYGRLTYRRRIGRSFRHAMIQDMAQVVSGQGVPPPDLAGWAAVYLEAGATLVSVTEGEHDGLRWFLHVVRLRSEPESTTEGSSSSPSPASL